MSDIRRTALFGKLNAVAYKAIEGATVSCRLRGHREVELVHWLQQILELADSDLHRLVRHAGLDPSRLARDVTAALERLPGGASSVSDLSADIEEAVERAWVYATLTFGESQVRTGYLLVAMLRTRRLRHVLLDISAEFGTFQAERLLDELPGIVAGSPEDRLAASDGFRAGEGTPGDAAPAALGKREALQRFTVDLTAQARDGAIDPVVGRDDEIRQVVDILMRRRQNNPMLVGEAGVGKTAVVEGFARRIVAGDVPPALREVELRVLDVGLLQAGASMKGEFESRLRQVIDEVQASPKPVILFIDEAHTLVGAGGAAGTGDAANLLKPALARGTLRTIGATTWAEYKKHIEKDPALTRRFQTVQVGEPDEGRGVLMLRTVAGVMESHHGVQVLDEAIEAAVKLSHRYIPARQLPDKAVSLLDTACARVAVSHHAVPAAVADARRRIEALEVEASIIRRESAVGMDTSARAAAVETATALEVEKLAELEQAWHDEKGLVESILGLRARLREASAATDAFDADAVRIELATLQANLADLQGEHPLIHPWVDAQAVAAVLADWTGIPVGRMLHSEVDAVLNLADTLGKRVIGQDHAMQAIARRVQTSRAGLDDPSKPVGVFLLAGTSGVGKTETALALAEALYGGEQNLITINMSEFQEAHTVSTLKGAPPGYVGYGEGGVLTEAVRRRPYSVVLLDEVEKAHPDVHEIFFQVFDKGVMEDGEGRSIDFRNTLIILTTNAGTEAIAHLYARAATQPDPETMAAALRAPLLDVFPPALLGRLVTVPYYPLSGPMLGSIVRLQLERIRRRVESRYGVTFAYTDAVVDHVVSRCTESESGGRMIGAILTNTMLPDVSRAFLTRTMTGASMERVEVDVADAGFVYRFDDAVEVEA
ncbi:type VI secretion system ATPase TssH [Luteibacter aegosomatis]|uniref:type VI secretion system ATPase TssH n=1 Tax=Luteibacter aegosomatis TaxID=2911537 RepID=UPI001FF890E1|nr:type VI secretion system ATPase TssH [Luteibacter aegosomatis]UPG84796.1 type VI secretion system ATPase TssH [Luteibacter aegosomatis]